MAGYLGQKPAVNGIYTVDEFTSSGGTTYTLSRAPGSKNNIQVNAGGLAQYPSAYSVSGTTLTLSGVPSGQKVVVRHMGETILYPNLDDNIVTLAKMAPGTDGNIITYDASGNPAAVATGTAGQVLTSAGAGAPPTFADAGGGGYTSEALVSLTSGTTKDITIASGVTSIVIHFNLISITGSSVLTMQLGDAGGIETSGYISLGMDIPNGAANSAQSYTDRFIIGPRMVDSDVLVGAITLTRGDTSTHYWSVTSVLNDRASEDQKLHSGNKTLSAELTTIRLLGGTFDGAGSYSLSYM